MQSLEASTSQAKTLGGEEVMTYPGDGTPGRPRDPVPGAGRQPTPPGPGERRGLVPRPGETAGWGQPEPPWAPGSRRRSADETGAQTVLIQMGKPRERPQGGGSNPAGGDEPPQPVYLHLEPHPFAPAYTAKIVAIYGLTLALQTVLFFAAGGSIATADSLHATSWQVGMGILAVFLAPAVSGILVDDPKSVWAKRWLHLVYVGCLLVWACAIGSLYLQFA